MKLKYGTHNNYIDITHLLPRFIIGDKLRICGNDVDRFLNFKIDPCPGIVKHILLEDEEKIYSDTGFLFFNCDDEIYDLPLKNINFKHPHFYYCLDKIYLEPDPLKKLEKIHKLINLKYGSMNDEFPEQMMVINYLPSDRKVLEIGSNIGRNTLVIATILSDDRNLVTLECSKSIALQLQENKLINNCNFHIENSALSKRKLVQSGWDSKPSDQVKENDKLNNEEISLISFTELEAKYNIQFDTLIADCEGALFYILQDMPETLDNITMIIKENDYVDEIQKTFVLNRLRERGFKPIYSEMLMYGGLFWSGCNTFYQVWIR